MNDDAFPQCMSTVRFHEVRSLVRLHELLQLNRLHRCCACDSHRSTDCFWFTRFDITL